jgi:hypothetical protein
MQLLPGQYTSTTNPQLHDLLISPSSTLVGSPGFQSASLSSLPLDLQLEPGLAIYSGSFYSGQASFAKLPDAPVANTSIPLSASSIAIAPNVWVIVSNNNRRLILWDSVPDTSQLPSAGSLHTDRYSIISLFPPLFRSQCLLHIWYLRMSDRLHRVFLRILRRWIFRANLRTMPRRLFRL